MKIAHFAVFSPNQSGMYGTVRDLILAERMQGIDAQFVDYTVEKGGALCSKVGLFDDGVATISHDWAYREADIIVRHSAVPDPIVQVGTPIIMAMHGRPEYSFMQEHYGQNPVMKIITDHEADQNYTAYLTFWKEHLPFWSLVMPRRNIQYVPCPVDLTRFCPDGKQFSSPHWNGRPNIIVADMWREDITPFSMIPAVDRFRTVYCREAKLHLFGLPPATKGFSAQLGTRLRSSGLVGEANTLVPFLDTVYRAADILVTPHRIATRVIREALASGCPVVAGTGCAYTPYTADPRDPETFAAEINRCWLDVQGGETRPSARLMAEQSFGYEATGKAMLALGEAVLQVPKPPRPAYQWAAYSIDPTDWIVLRDFLIHEDIKNVLEIGPGLSTELMDDFGIEVLSYETEPIYVERMRRRVSKRVDVRQWSGLWLPEIDQKYRLAFLDGPAGGESRESAYRILADSSVQFVACHDSKRAEDKVWIDKYLGDWTEVARNDRSVQGLLILKRGE